MVRKLIPIPSRVTNLLYHFHHLNEKKRDTCKSSWVSWTGQKLVQDLETLSTRNKQTIKLTTIKETKLNCIRELEPKLTKQLTNIHATNG
jgi:hypothetical protein